MKDFHFVLVRIWLRSKLGPLVTTPSPADKMGAQYRSIVFTSHHPQHYNHPSSRISKPAAP